MTIKINRGDVFGFLKYIQDEKSLTSIKGAKIRMCLFECKCGNKKTIRLNDVRHGKTKSCGCYMMDRVVKHGLSKHTLYDIYLKIIGRCNNKKHFAYKWYGARGIKCEWEKLEDFIIDMGDSYKKGLQIDRINNNGNYSKENCRWANSLQQARNRRGNIMYKGKCIAEWCQELGLNYNTIISRIGNSGWTIEKAFNTKIRNSRNKNTDYN